MGKKASRVHIRTSEDDSENFFDRYVEIYGGEKGKTFFLYDPAIDDEHEQPTIINGEWKDKFVPLSIRRGYNALQQFAQEILPSERLLFGTANGKNYVAIELSFNTSEYTSNTAIDNAMSFAEEYPHGQVYIDETSIVYDGDIYLIFCIPLPTDMETLRTLYKTIKEYMTDTLYKCKFEITFTGVANFTLPKSLENGDEESIKAFARECMKTLLQQYNVIDFCREGTYGCLSSNEIEIERLP